MVRVIAACLVLCSFSLASAQTVLPEDYAAAMAALQAQRDAANNQVVEVKVQLMRALRELESTKKQVPDPAPK